VLGGGTIGCELAQVFARFDSRVTVVESADRLLSAEEPEAGRMLAEVFAGEGVAVLVGATVTAVRHDEHGFTLDLDDGEQLAARRLLVATGRGADLAALGVGAAGLDEQARRLPVDERMRAAPGVWALGDLTGKGEFTHVSMYQAEIVVREILGESGPAADYRALPRVTFTDPEIAAVGLTEARAAERGIAVRTGSTRLSTTARGWIHKAGNDGFIKLVADADRGTLVGATSAGPAGGEVLGALAVAVHGEVPVRRLRHMIYAYPTFHRGIEDALRDLDA
jgi:pyruvate/2-oxoglutarate dehydrogenase complex dihydrolipoamide dehydrogenase (E3) component